MFEELRETNNFGYGERACRPVQLLSCMESLKSLSPKQPKAAVANTKAGSMNYPAVSCF